MTDQPARPGPAPRYITDRARELLNRCFPGLIPARVIEEALQQKALREGRLAPKPGRQP
ncbi:hypothetical protein [Streptomyces ortus]|uniref:Uncharacterized protein n=1 Tax=Streptomyces ortus TaxID=2867268 RepID=A0ABT3UWY5_9ACTN|nr:hypothetical protein [Streptomyces ortus]MCX4232070.1 hypothetical protein [Streptomyces ortus]